MAGSYVTWADHRGLGARDAGRASSPHWWVASQGVRTWIVTDAVAVAPALSLTCNSATYVPSPAYTWDPLPDGIDAAPSPRSHAAL